MSNDLKRYKELVELETRKNMFQEIRSELVGRFDGGKITVELDGSYTKNHNMGKVKFNKNLFLAYIDAEINTIKSDIEVIKRIIG